MAKYEVTQAQWLALMGSWPFLRPGGDEEGDDFPGFWLAWVSAQDFITSLNEHVLNTSQGPGTFRLPTEAEWEYGCRAGSDMYFSFGDSDCDPLQCGEPCELDEHAWYCGNSNSDLLNDVGGDSNDCNGSPCTAADNQLKGTWQTACISFPALNEADSDSSLIELLAFQNGAIGFIDSYYDGLDCTGGPTSEGTYIGNYDLGSQTIAADGTEVTRLSFTLSRYNSTMNWCKTTKESSLTTTVN